MRNSVAFGVSVSLASHSNQDEAIQHEEPRPRMDRGLEAILGREICCDQFHRRMTHRALIAEKASLRDVYLPRKINSDIHAGHRFDRTSNKQATIN